VVGGGDRDGRGMEGRDGDFFIDLLVRIPFVIEMIWWTDLAPWEFEFSFPGSLVSTFLYPTPYTLLPNPLSLNTNS